MHPEMSEADRIAVLKAKIERLEKERDSVPARLAEARAQQAAEDRAAIERLTRARDAALAAVEAARTDRAENDQKAIDQLTRLIGQTQTERARALADLETKRLRVVQLGDVVAEKQAGIDAAAAALGEAHRVIATLESQLKEAIARAATVEADAEAAEKRMGARIAALETERGAALDEARQALTQARTEVAQAQKGVDEMKMLLRARIERERIDGVAP